MSDISLTDQAVLKTEVESKLIVLKGTLDDRKALFRKCSLEKRKAWMDKDPVIKMAWDQFKELKEFFGEQDYENIPAKKL